MSTQAPNESSNESPKPEEPAVEAQAENTEAATEAAPEAELTPEQQQIADLQVELEAAKAKADENWDKLLRAQAEMENIRKRAARDVENARKFALEGIASELLPVRDSLELGLDSVNQDDAEIQSARDGMQLIQQMLAKLMEQYGIKPVDPVGEAFNPELHQAMSMQESAEHPANSVMAVMQKGYTLNDRLLRPAMVVVAKATAAEEKDEEKPGE